MRPPFVAAAALLLLAACSQASPGGQGDGGAQGQGWRGGRNQDANNDGRVTLDEARTAQRRTFDRFDANHDGSLSFEEIEAMPERLADRMDRMDTDADREVSRAEIDKAAEERFRRRDKNGDGVLSGEERRYVRERDTSGQRPAEPL